MHKNRYNTTLQFYEGLFGQKPPLFIWEPTDLKFSYKLLAHFNTDLQRVVTYMLKIRSTIGFKEMQEKFTKKTVVEEKKVDKEEMLARRNTLK